LGIVGPDARKAPGDLLRLPGASSRSPKAIPGRGEASRRTGVAAGMMRDVVRYCHLVDRTRLGVLLKLRNDRAVLAAAGETSRRDHQMNPKNGSRLGAPLQSCRSQQRPRLRYRCVRMHADGERRRGDEQHTKGLERRSPTPRRSTWEDQTPTPKVTTTASFI